MTRIESLRARLAAATPHVIGKPTITELEDLLDDLNTKVDIAPSGEVTVCSPLLIAPQDLRDLLKLYDAAKKYVTGGDDVTITKILTVLSTLDSSVGDKGAE